MTASPEVVAARDRLTEAIDELRRLLYPDDAGRVLTDYVVIYGETWLDEHGEPDDGTGQLVRDGNLASYRLRGLLLEGLDANRPASGAAPPPGD